MEGKEGRMERGRKKGGRDKRSERGKEGRKEEAGMKETQSC